MPSKTKLQQTQHLHNVRLAKIVVKSGRVFVNNVRFNYLTWARLNQEYHKSDPLMPLDVALRAVAVRYIQGTPLRVLMKEYYVSWGTFQKLFHAFGVHRPWGGRQPSHDYTKKGDGE